MGGVPLACPFVRSSVSPQEKSKSQKGDPGKKETRENRGPRKKGDPGKQGTQTFLIQYVPDSWT